MIASPTQGAETDQNVARLKRALSALERIQARLDAVERAAAEPIAIVGMSCRFPGGANDPESLWRLLCAGADCICEVPRDRWDIDAFYDPDPAAPGKMYTRWGGFLKDWAPDRFDARFFGIAPREAEGIDPQHRLLLEVAHEALERAGQTTSQLAGSATGVFVGIMTADYAALHLKTNDATRLDAYYGLGNEPSFSAGRLSYLLGLNGPSVALSTACSSSLVALDQAVQSLRTKRCDLAIAGGVSLLLSPDITIASCRIGSQSPRGRCRTFDASADGYVRAEGCGVVVLKRLSDAVASGDQILACVRGTATNHDGASGGLTVPSGPAQEKLLRAALADAHADPADIVYVETHGTGTPLGDPIEARALGAVLGGRSRKSPLAIGSIKTNMGHAEAAAGMAGLMKAILILQHHQIPPHCHLERQTEHVAWDDLNLTVPTTLTELRGSEHPLVGISSFGLSGINAHAVLEAAPATTRATDDPTDEPRLLPLSARSGEALASLARRYLDFLTSDAGRGTRWLDIVHTASQRRFHHEHRLALIARHHDEAATKLDSFLSGDAMDGLATTTPDRQATQVAFLFSGQGSQWAAMGRSLAESEPVFREALERCGRAIAAAGGPAELTILDSISTVQPALFAIQVALTELLRSWGVEPGAVAGHSMGEVAAAYAAGALSLADAAGVIVLRSQLLAGIEGQGSMAAVDLSLEDASAAMAGYEGRLSIAGVNGPRSAVLSGEPCALEEVLANLEASGVFCRKVNVTVASHSTQVEPLLPNLAEGLASIRPQRNIVPFVSTVTGTLLNGSALDAAYWQRNLREPVLFGKAIESLAQDGYGVFVEISPHPILLHSVEHGQRLASLRRESDERSALLSLLGSLYAAGHEPKFEALSKGGRATLVPTYPWQRERCWSLDSTLAKSAPSAPRANRTQGGPTGFYDALARSTGATREESYLTFGIHPQGAPAFSWLRAAMGIAPSTLDAEFFLSGQRALRRALFDSIDMTRVARALDFGCGYGSDLLTLASGHPHLRLDGYTISEEQAAIGRRRIEARGLSGRVEIHQSDSSADPFPAMYDLIFGFEVATHIPDKAALFANIERHLNASGYLLMADFVVMSASNIDVADTASYNATGSQWLDLFTDHRMRIVEAIDISAEAARFLDDPDFEQNLRLVETRASLTPVERRNFQAMANFGRALERGLLQYMLFIVQKDELARPDYLRRSNRQWIEKPTAYADRLPSTPAALSDEWFYHIQWDRAPLPSRKTSLKDVQIAIVGDRGRVAARLAQLLALEGAHAAVVEVTGLDGLRVDHIVHLAGLDAEDESALLELPLCVRGPRLWIATRDSQPVGSGAAITAAFGTALWGMARTIAVETPEMWGGIVDLGGDDAPDTSARAILAEILAGGAEDQVVYRRGVRHIARLVRHPWFEPRTVEFASDATYLITGGLGDLGLATAEWMAQQGARSLVLVSRTAHANAATRSLEDRGVRVLVAAADVADEAAMTAVFGQMRDEHWPPLRGIIHAAGVVRRIPVRELTREGLAADLRAKTQGSLVLHRLTHELALDFFVLFSSGSAILGSPALAGYAAGNAFQDGLAHARHALGLPALSIDWGFWAERGMAAREGGAVPRGMQALTADEALGAMGRLLGQRDPQVAVLRMNAEEFAHFHPEYARLPLMKSLLSRGRSVEPEIARDARILESLEAAPAGFRRRSVMESYLKDQLARVLKSRPGDITVNTPMQKFGVDSLMAIEFRNRLEKDLGLKLPATLAFSHPTLSAIADHLASQLNLPLNAVEKQSPTAVAEWFGDEIAAKLAAKLAALAGTN